MTKLYSSIIILALLCPAALSAQPSDMVVVKKKGRTERTLFAGMNTEFRTVDQQWIKGQIRTIQNDTIFLYYFDIRRVPTPFGTFYTDTIARIPIACYYKDIVALHKRRESFGFIKNGLLFKIGGVGYGLLNLINGGGKDRNNTGRLLIAAGIAGTGFVMGRLHQPMIIVGRNAELIYVEMADGSR